MSHRVTLIPGDGVGPEINESARRKLGDTNGVAHKTRESIGRTSVAYQALQVGLNPVTKVLALEWARHRCSPRVACTTWSLSPSSGVLPRGRLLSVPDAAG